MKLGATYYFYAIGSGKTYRAVNSFMAQTAALSNSLAHRLHQFLAERAEMLYGWLMDKDIQRRLIRDTISQLKLLADGPSDDLRSLRSEFCALTDSLRTLVTAPALPSLSGPQTHFDENGHMWL